VVEGDGEPIGFHLGEDYQEGISFHRWFEMRGASAARAAVAFTKSPEWLGDPEKLALVAVGDDAAIAATIAQSRSSRKAENIDSDSTDESERLLDLCAGIGTMAAMAARLGFDALSVESSIVPHLVNQVLHDFAVSMAAAAGVDEEGAGSWRGFATEVEDFADAVWRGAKERLKCLFEDDVDIRVWVRITDCPFCGRQVPLLSNARLSRNAALNVCPDPGLDGEIRFPRFGLLKTAFPDRKGTFAKGFCTCPSCHNRFRFQGHDLISRRLVPVAVRMRDGDELSEMDSPDNYVKQTEKASYDSLAASSRGLGNRFILAGNKSMFHDARGDSIDIQHALLPRQRAYFAALAESMGRESALLARRAALTNEHRFAIRSAVALLISSQADYVNSYTHSFIDKAHPSTSAGPLRVGGLFTEVGGYWLERFWQNRLRHLLNLLKENASAARPVRAINADAAKIPLGDAAVAAVVWDPPYYDKVDYDTASEHYQAILAAVVPDIVSELVVPPKLPPEKRKERNESDLLRQASEARRVVSPSGSIGVFWPARGKDELQRFVDLVAPAGLQLVRAVRLDTIRPPRVASAGPQTYLLVLQPIPAEASAVAVDAGKVLSLDADGALSLYDGLADLLESVWEPAELDEMIPAEFRGSSRQRLAAFLASHPEPERLLVELGRPVLLRELVNRGTDREELRAIDIRGLAQQLLGQLGFAVARPVRFSIRETLHECEIVNRGLELADSIEVVRGAFLTGFSHIERILRYASFAWGYLACGDQWNEVFDRVVSSALSEGLRYPGPDKLAFGHFQILFTKLPGTFANSGKASEKAPFVKIAQAIKKAKANDKLSALVTLRNIIGHDKKKAISLSLPQLRQECSTAITEACAALTGIDNQRLLPLTVRPVEERRDRYGRRVLRLLDADNAAIEVYVGSETDLTEPLIYFASDNSRRDVYPKFIRAAIVDDLLGFSEQDSRPALGGRSQPAS
jgi:hypothetical protein